MEVAHEVLLSRPSMGPTRAAGAGCILRAVRLYLLFVVGAVLLALSAGYLVAARAVRRAEKAWAAEGESMEAFAARFPTHPDSPAALALDEMTRPLGIRMCRANDTGSEAAQGANEETLTSIGRMITSCGSEGIDECASLSPEGARFLRREGERLEAIEAHILEGGPLEWDQDITKGIAAPIPSLLGHRHLQNVLLARAVEHARQGRQAAAERSLEASWRVNASLAERPALITRLITVAVAGMQQGVLRTLRRPPERWLPRMRERTFATDIGTPYQFEAWTWTRFTVDTWGIFDLPYMESGEEPPRTFLGTAGRILTAPYVRLSFAGSSEALLEATRELSGQRRCDLDVERYSKEFEEAFPRWNIMGRISTPAVVRGWASMQQTDFDRELTERVLMARLQRQSSGRWPSTVVPSTVCEGIRWEQTPGPDGTLTIDASERPFTTESRPNRWSVRLHR